MSTELKQSEVSRLREACQCLYLAVDATIADDVKAKAEAVIAQLQNSRATPPTPASTTPEPLHFRHPADGEEVERVKCEVLDCNESQSCFHYCHEHHIAICRPASPLTVPTEEK